MKHVCDVSNVIVFLTTTYRTATSSTFNFFRCYYQQTIFVRERTKPREKRSKKIEDRAVEDYLTIRLFWKSESKQQFNLYRMRMTQIMAAAWLCRTSMAFVSRELTSTGYRLATKSVSRSLASGSLQGGPIITTRLFSVSNDIEAIAKSGVSRMETLQTMLSSHGAPGSVGCSSPDDLEPVCFSTSVANSEDAEDTPELVANIMGLNEYANLHPHLYPLAKSKSTGNFICALRRAFADDASDLYENSSKAPWPIVEAEMNGPGMRLIALNSEHLMRRIVCECDFGGERNELIELYNGDLGKGVIKDKSLDEPYEKGSVEKLGWVPPLLFV
jgi:hypothetical protein